MVDQVEGGGEDYSMKSVPVYLVVLGTLSFCIVVGNILVLLTFVRDATLRNSTGLLIICLALCDLLTGLIAVPTVLMSMIDNFDLMKHGLGCDFSGVLVFSCFNCSLLTLSLISLQRYFLITKPHNQMFTKKKIKIMILFIWVYSFGASMVPLLPSFNGFILYPWSLSCILDLSGDDQYRNKYYSAIYNSLTFLIAGVTISMTQYRILRIVYTRTKSRNVKCLKTRQLSETRRFYATKMISCMIAGFLLCTTPIMILLFLKVAENIPPKEYAAFAGFMTWFNSLLNPIIYWYFNKKYSKEVRGSIRRGSKLLKQLSSKALLIPLRKMSLNRSTNSTPTDLKPNMDPLHEEIRVTPEVEATCLTTAEEGLTVAGSVNQELGTLAEQKNCCASSEIRKSKEDLSENASSCSATENILLSEK